MRPSRRAQLYRKGANRPAGMPLANMKRGKTVYGQHPQDMPRLASKRAARRRRRLRK